MTDDTREEARTPPRKETSDIERERTRSPNDQALEREGIESEDSGHDDATQGRSGDVDPDSAESDVDRDDTLEE